MCNKEAALNHQNEKYLTFPTTTDQIIITVNSKKVIIKNLNCVKEEKTHRENNRTYETKIELGTRNHNHNRLEVIPRIYTTSTTNPKSSIYQTHPQIETNK